jgi:hypothetical protein
MPSIAFRSAALRFNLKRRMRNGTRLGIALGLLGFILSASAGSIAWRHTFDGGAPDEGMGVKTDAAGNAYVAWMTYLAPRAWIMVSKLDVNGAEQWNVSLPVATAGPPKSGSCRIAVAGEDTYVVCHEDSADRLAFVARVTGAGSVAWTASVTDISWPTAFESDGNAVYLTGTNSAGQVTDTNTAGQVTIDKFDATGASWTLLIPNAATAGLPMVASALTIAGNDVLVTGWAETDSVDYTNHQVVEAFAARCNVDGALNWVRTVGSTNKLNSRGNSIAETANGDVIIGGTQTLYDTNGLAMLADNLLVRFDATGNELLRSAVPKAGFIQWVLPHASGDVFTLGNDSANNLRITRTSPDGTVLWRRVQNSNRPVSAGDAVAAAFGTGILVAGFDYKTKTLYLSQLDADTGKGHTKLLSIPAAASHNPVARRDFNLDGAGQLYFLTGDGTPWPDVVAIKYRGAAQ